MSWESPETMGHLILNFIDVVVSSVWEHLTLCDLLWVFFSIFDSQINVFVDK